MENKNYLELRRKEQPSWMYPALSREAWEGYSRRMKKGLRDNVCRDGFAEALAWFYSIDVGGDRVAYVDPAEGIRMMPYTDGHVKAPQAILFLVVCDASDGKVCRKYRLEMTWVDYYMVSQRYVKWVAERWAI